MCIADEGLEYSDDDDILEHNYSWTLAGCMCISDEDFEYSDDDDILEHNYSCSRDTCTDVSLWAKLAQISLYALVATPNRFY